EAGSDVTSVSPPHKAKLASRLAEHEETKRTGFHLEVCHRADIDPRHALLVWQPGEEVLRTRSPRWQMDRSAADAREIGTCRRDDRPGCANAVRPGSRGREAFSNHQISELEGVLLAGATDRESVECRHAAIPAAARGHP